MLKQQVRYHQLSYSQGELIDRSKMFGRSISATEYPTVPPSENGSTKIISISRNLLKVSNCRL